MNWITNRWFLRAALGVGVALTACGQGLELSLKTLGGVAESSPYTLTPNTAGQEIYIWLTNTSGGALEVMSGMFYAGIAPAGSGSNPAISAVQLVDLPGSPFTTANLKVMSSPGSYTLEEKSGTSTIHIDTGASFPLAKLTIDTVGVQRNATWDLSLFDTSMGGQDPSVLDTYEVSSPNDPVTRSMSVTTIQLTMVPEPETWAGFAAAGLLLAGFVVRHRRS